VLRMETKMDSRFRWTKVLVFVGAFSDFGDRVYRIPAPIFGQKRQKLSTPLQRGVGVRYWIRVWKTRAYVIEFDNGDALRWIEMYNVESVWCSCI
jgi:hypothetical protein